MSLSSKLRTTDIRLMGPIVFYGAVGIIFLALLPFANFPPHIGLTGILSLLTAYGLFRKRSWAPWLVIALFVVATTISLYTLYILALSNWIVGISMVTYAVLTWLVTFYIILRSKPFRA